MTTKVCLLLGGLFGTEADRPTSAGMLQLVGALSPIPVDVKDWGQWEEIRAPQPPDKFVLIGYSGGGTRAIMWANQQYIVPIDLMVLYDPSPSWQMQPIRKNVKQIITYENTAPMMPSLFGNLGGGVAVLAPDNTVTKIERVMIAEQHLAVQNDPALHLKTALAVRALYQVDELAAGSNRWP